MVRPLATPATTTSPTPPLPLIVPLERKGELAHQEYWDTDLTEHWRTLVRWGLESELTGEESTEEVRELVREMIDREIES